NGSESLDFAAVQLCSEGSATLGKLGEALRRHFLEVGGLGAKRGEGFVHFAAQRNDLSSARLAELIEPVETGDELFELALGDPAGVPDLAGDIARRIGNHRQVVSQAIHVFERGGADAPD